MAMRNIVTTSKDFQKTRTMHHTPRGEISRSDERYRGHMAAGQIHVSGSPKKKMTTKHMHEDSRYKEEKPKAILRITPRVHPPKNEKKEQHTELNPIMQAVERAKQRKKQALLQNQPQKMLKNINQSRVDLKNSTYSGMTQGGRNSRNMNFGGTNLPNKPIIVRKILKRNDNKVKQNTREKSHSKKNVSQDSRSRRGNDPYIWETIQRKKSNKKSEDNRKKKSKTSFKKINAPDMTKSNRSYAKATTRHSRTHSHRKTKTSTKKISQSNVIEQKSPADAIRIERMTMFDLLDFSSLDQQTLNSTDEKRGTSRERRGSSRERRRKKSSRGKRILKRSLKKTVVSGVQSVGITSSITHATKKTIQENPIRFNNNSAHAVATVPFPTTNTNIIANKTNTIASTNSTRKSLKFKSGEKKIKKFEPNIFYVKPLPQARRRSRSRSLNRNSLNQNPLNRNSLNRNSSNRNSLNQNSLNRKSLNRNTLNQNSLNQNSLNQNSLNRNLLNSQEMIVKTGKKSKAVYNNMFNLKAKNNSGIKKSAVKTKKTKLTKMKKIIINERLTKFIQQTILQPIICKVTGCPDPNKNLQIKKKKKRRKKKKKRLEDIDNPEDMDWQAFIQKFHLTPQASIGREYCRQMLSKPLDSAIAVFLTTLLGYQDRLRERDPMKAQMRKRYVCGLREVRKGIKNDKIIAVIVAPNVEIVTSKGGLDSLMQQILDLAHEKQVFIIFSMTRRKLAKTLRKIIGNVSAVGIMNIHGCEDLYKSIVQLTKEAREQWYMFMHDPFLNKSPIPYWEIDAQRTQRLEERKRKEKEELQRKEEIWAKEAEALADRYNPKLNKKKKGKKKKNRNVIEAYSKTVESKREKNRRRRNEEQKEKDKKEKDKKDKKKK